ncbi:hypothetical protein NQ317_010649 [Molorchus minor]|uniref:THAP-type domain-containing protein n=1 Tax=Molorchus minor TaxID=1323400 RepID=A0ABQ9IXW0_9CUCU|nr:hypothetical protein NQ317_010649 [Molorchus minor]
MIYEVGFFTLDMEDDFLGSVIAILRSTIPLITSGLYGYVLQPNFFSNENSAILQSLMFTFGIEVPSSMFKRVHTMIKCINMPSFCAIVGCSKRAERDEVRFFKIPKALKNRGERLDALSKERRESWVRALKRGNLSDTFLNNARICANHFVSGLNIFLNNCVWDIKRFSPNFVKTIFFVGLGLTIGMVQAYNLGADLGFLEWEGGIPRLNNNFCFVDPEVSQMCSSLMEWIKCDKKI